MRRSTIGVLSAAALVALGAVFAVVASGASKDSNGSNFQANSFKQNYTHTCTDQSSADGGGMPGDDMDQDGDTISFTGFKALWPPNHKYRYVTITATDNGPDSIVADHVRLSVVTDSNEPELGLGSGHTLMDANPNPASAEGDGSASVTIGLRGERDGKDLTHQFKGRTYTLHASANYDGTAAMANPTENCHADFTVRVPHDMGHG
jgi:hypothetical protein